LKNEQTYRRIVARMAVGLVCLMTTGTTVLAQDNAKPATERWQPKDGLYGLPGKDLEASCGHNGVIILQLAEKSVVGDEWDCTVIRRTDTAPDAIRLNMTCSDVNLDPPLAPNRVETEFKEVLELKRLSANSLLGNKTQNGKFPEAASWRVDYCPEKWQRSYIELKAKDKMEAEQKAKGASSKAK
jgi:hypothetical protein